jgi:hypothetical protein
VFRILALALLAYVPAAILARPDFVAILTGTLVPTMRFNREFLSLLVAVIGTTLSAYLYTWPSNEEVEEEKPWGDLRFLNERVPAAGSSAIRGAMCCLLPSRAWENLPFSIGTIPPTATLVDQYFNDSTGTGDRVRRTRGDPGTTAATGK